jgi:electron transfer flavoprotein beta subunit
MNIAVCVKQVPDTGSVAIDPKTNTLRRAGAGTAINPLDEFAVEAALNLREENGGTVTAITMGPPKAEDALARSIAMGTDKGIILSCSAFAGSDTWSTSLILARAIEKYGPFDLVICGKQAIDGDTAQVGPEIAAHLGIPQAMNVCAVGKFSGRANSLTVKRLFENGTDEIELCLPAVIAVLKDVGEPRFGTLHGRLNYFKKGVEKSTAADLDVPPSATGLKGSPTRVIKTFTPSIVRKNIMIEGSPEEQAEQMARVIKKHLDKL